MRSLSTKTLWTSQGNSSSSSISAARARPMRSSAISRTTVRNSSSSSGSSNGWSLTASSLYDGGGDLRDAADGLPVVPDVDRWWLHIEGRQGGAHLAAMVAAVVKRLGQPDAHRRAGLRTVFVCPDDHGVRVRAPGEQPQPFVRMAFRDRPELAQVHCALVDVRHPLLGHDEQVPRIAPHEVSHRVEDG